MPVELITEHSPLWLVACLLLGLLYAFVLYRYPAVESLGKVLHRLLFLFRALVVSFLAFFSALPLIAYPFKGNGETASIACRRQ